MKRLLSLGVALLSLVCARPALAQVYGQFSGATPVAVDHRLFGIYGGLSTKQSELLAQLRLCFYPNLDFGFHGGLSHISAGGRTRTAVLMGGDLKTQVARRTAAFPVDVSMGGALGLTSADQLNIMSFGPTVVASRRSTFNSGAELVPYAGAALLFARRDLNDRNDTDVALQLRLGLEYTPNSDFRLVVEVQAATSDPADRHPKLMLGANFPF